jgi:hypothetical protein
VYESFNLMKYSWIRSQKALNFWPVPMSASLLVLSQLIHKCLSSSILQWGFFGALSSFFCFLSFFQLVSSIGLARGRLDCIWRGSIGRVDASCAGGVASC